MHSKAHCGVENVVWEMRSNFLDLPTNCSRRDERLGWFGDIQVSSPTASFPYDCAGILQSWLQDLAADQQDAGGIVPNIVLDIFGGIGGAAAAWGDAAMIVPWVLHQRFGDTGILAQQFESMRSLGEIADRCDRAGVRPACSLAVSRREKLSRSVNLCYPGTYE
jgi:alpha-L-rhamnosidase